jgi:hypothetical protein
MITVAWSGAPNPLPVDPMHKHSLATRMGAIVVACLMAIGISGCRSTDPFACLDQCFLADWTNHWSCASCCQHCGEPPEEQP